ncbi:protein-L-isoaspartate(D-aspartate) O-methyltransferase [Streptomyces sp. SLBN-118]|uniref:protein-L-isoaspartate(D-aspartate) O-methyltransferase n=1 Tax=Streptomyces sp. SLBN-118 TaxID=2768454 RepID=UPI001150B7EB|nr:protein-L-isoaspartate(D-aspartate) O-methyltransferase [Streptomyces sp. SLBN-118]TQK50131.1 protein-L-isoaspartate(D-aspartate) O-methyltransferase [Streptomyces sp. SLBN-118]
MPQPSPGLTPEDLVSTARALGVVDERLLQVMRVTPRSAFVPASHHALAYADVPIPISHGQVTTQPSLVAMMIAALGLAGSERILEIGTGYGFQTALLARLATYVVSVELWPDMAEKARGNLADEGVQNVEIVVGDGTLGMAGHAPYDAVIVCAAFPKVPPPLVEQLRIGGRLVQPIGPGGQEEVELYERTAHGLVRRRVVTAAHFVRLYGRYGYPPTSRFGDAE